VILKGVFQLLQTGATTVGISPKALAPVISAGIFGLCKLAHVNVPPVVVMAIAGSVAAWLLPPGHVHAGDPQIGPGSDARLDPTHAPGGLLDDVVANLGKVAKDVL